MLRIWNSYGVELSSGAPPDTTGHAMLQRRTGSSRPGQYGEVGDGRVTVEPVELGRLTAHQAPHRRAKPLPGDAVQEEVGGMVDIEYLHAIIIQVVTEF